MMAWGDQMEKAAIYCRLSKEDKMKLQKEEESESIQNQKLLLTEYARKHGFSIYKEYIDDDYSGMDQERPAFCQLIQDAKQRRFQVLLCKSQSRFTRDLELVERYIHGLFPLWGIRFIGVVDFADTDVKENKKARQINALINEWYCEDLSENIKSVFRVKMEQGQYLGAFSPYGYKKDPRDKHKLLIDEKAAKVVAFIFESYRKGYGISQICNFLYEKKIPTPSQYRKLQEVPCASLQSIDEKGKLYLWGKSTVRKILTNPVYTGAVVQGRETKLGVKSKKVIPLPKEQWIAVDHCHEAIIEKELFDKVQELLKLRRYAKGHESSRPYLFAGKVRCGICHSIMTKTKGRNGMVYLYCSMYRRTKGEKCSGNSIPLQQLKKEFDRQTREKWSDTFLSSIEKEILVNCYVEKIEIRNGNGSQQVRVFWSV